MILMLNKRLVILIVMAFFLSLTLILALSRPQPPTEAYTFVADTWDLDPRSKGPVRLNQKYVLISLPDASRINRSLSRTTPTNVIEAAFIHYAQVGGIMRVWSRPLLKLPYPDTAAGPNIWSPDHRYITFGLWKSKDRQIGVRGWLGLGILDLNTGESRMLPDVVSSPDTIVWSPDASALVYTMDDGYDPADQQYKMVVRTISVNGDQPSRVLFTYTSLSPMDFDPDIRWLPDGKHIALLLFPREKGIEVRFLDVQTAQETFYYASLSLMAQDVCWSPKTNHFIAAFDSGFQLVTPDGTPRLDTRFIDPAIWKLDPGALAPCAWSPDGEKVSLMVQPDDVRIIDFAARQVREIPNIDDLLYHAFWSPDSRMLALTTYNFNNAPDLYIYDTSTMQQVFSHRSLNFITWLPQLP